MDVLLNTISITGTFFLVLGFLYFVQKLTIGFLPIFKKVVLNRFILGDLVFITTSLLFILIFVDINPIY